MIYKKDDRAYYNDPVCGSDAYSIKLLGRGDCDIQLPDGTPVNLVEDARCGSCNRLLDISEFSLMCDYLFADAVVDKLSR